MKHLQPGMVDLPDRIVTNNARAPIAGSQIKILQVTLVDYHFERVDNCNFQVNPVPKKKRSILAF